jgi:hypothetical protein
MPEPNREQGQYYAAPQCFLRGSGKPGSTALILLAGEVPILVSIGPWQFE